MKKVVIIGGGLGGLSAAISIAALPGYSVTILEKNNHLGGKLNVKDTHGYSFDLGPSILTMPHLFENLFTKHKRKMSDYIQIEPVRPHWRNFFEDGTTIDLTHKIEDMLTNKALTPQDLQDLKAYYAYTEKIYGVSAMVAFDNQLENTWEAMRFKPSVSIFQNMDYFSTMDQGVRRYIRNPYLIDILNYFIKYVGSSPYDAPALMNLLPYIQWKYDLWYVKGGMFNISKGLVKLIGELPQINIKTQSEVISVEKKNQSISKIHLKSAESLDADLIISNMEAIPFYEKITKESKGLIARYQRKFEPACSGFALHLGTNKVYPQLAHHNFFYSKNSKTNFNNIFHRHTLNPDPTIYLVAPMRTDLSQGPKGGDIIKILPHIPYLDPKKPFSKEDYQIFRLNILNKLERMGLTDLRKHIVVEELWTPETIQDMYYSNRGSIYGVVASKKKNMGFKIPKRSKLYQNVYFVGGSVNPGGGMPMVVLSGQQVVDQIVKDKKN
ncbi:MAG: phytoene desaturase [Firmicutes bacterium]|nr:phytoene desaturase [Bacillota bacterium]